MKFLHIRHATSILTYGGVKFLTDPMLSDMGVAPAIPMTPCKRRNPLVGLSTPIDTITHVDAILSTHIHPDHFDEKAIELLDKKIPIIAQSSDEKALNDFGFNNIIAIEKTIDYKGIKITRVKAQHGEGAVGEMMGEASGYILSAANEPTVYILGDTIYNKSIRENIEKYNPDVLVISAGSPKFLNSNQIVMNIMDVEETIKINPKLNFVIVHLDTFNHCIETREDMNEYFTKERLESMGASKFFIPKDNETLKF